MPAELTIALFRFDEPADEVLPSDAVGTVGDLTVETGITLPVVENAYTGRGREFSPPSLHGLVGADNAGESSLLQRDVTVQAIVNWNLLAQNSYGSPGVLVCRGRDGSAAERYAYGLEFRVINSAFQIGEVRWFWQTIAGTLKTQVGGHFRAPSDGFLIITAVRRWISSTEVSLTYYAGDRLLAEVLSADGDIGGGTTGMLSVGARKAAGAWGNFFAGTVDELRISNYAMTAEEIQATYRRIAEHQPMGEQLVVDHLPPGLPISSDPGSRVRREIRAIGNAVGFASGQLQNIADNILPDRAYGAVLRRWERITAQNPKASADVAARRARVLGRLRQRGGVSPPAVQEALRYLLSVAPEQIPVYAFSADVLDPFNALLTERWMYTEPADWTILSGQLRAQAIIGRDIRWDETNSNGLFTIMGVEAGGPGAGPDQELEPRGAEFFVKVDPTGLPTTAQAGIFLVDSYTRSATWLAVRNNAGTFQVVEQRYFDGVPVALSVLATTSNTPHWLHASTQHVVSDSGFLSANQSYMMLRWSTTGPTTGFSQSEKVIQDRYNWGGMGCRATAASLATALDVRFDDWRSLIKGSSRRAFHWYAFRDPALPGNYDLIGANGLVKRVKQAHTHAAVITSLSMLCDDAESGCDLGPMGCY